MKRKIAIITGVSRVQGIGRAICLELAKRNHDIFFTYWHAYDRTMPWGVSIDEPDFMQKEVQDLGVHCEKLELDLSSSDAPRLLISEVNNKMGHPHVLINNATYSTTTSIDSMTSVDMDRHYNVNVKAITMLTIEFIKDFAHETGGRIINLTSGQSLGAMPNEIAYAISKGAIETLTATIYQEIARKGITINAVNPGPNDTGWMTDELKMQLKKQFPMNRIGVPQDTAHLIGFLASEEGGWITGQVIHSEGGFIR